MGHRVVVGEPQLTEAPTAPPAARLRTVLRHARSVVEAQRVRRYISMNWGSSGELRAGRGDGPLPAARRYHQVDRSDQVVLSQRLRAVETRLRIV